MAQLLVDALQISFTVGVLAVLLAAFTPLLQKRYAARLRCWAWLVLALRLLVPVRLDRPASAPVQLAVPKAAVERVVYQGAPAQQAVNAETGSFASAPAGQAGGAAQPQSSEQATTPENTQQTDAVPGAAQNAAPGSGQQQAAGAGHAGEMAPSGGTPVQTAGAGADAARPVLTLADALLALWLGGAAFCILYHAAGYALWRARMMRWNRLPSQDMAVCCEKARRLAGCRRALRVRQNPHARCPMVVGVLRPMLLLPEKLCVNDETALMLLHEYTHVRRRDVAFKSVLLAAACLHWYNPVVWLMQRCAARDVELACDEGVLALCGGRCRLAYSQALLHSAAGGNMAFSTRFGGGKRAMKQRFRNIFAGGARRRGTALLCAFAICLGLAVQFASCTVEPGAALPSGAVRVELPEDYDAVFEAQADAEPLEQWEQEYGGFGAPYVWQYHAKISMTYGFSYGGVPDIWLMNSMGEEVILRAPAECPQASNGLPMADGYRLGDEHIAFAVCAAEGLDVYTTDDLGAVWRSERVAADIETAGLAGVWFDTVDDSETVRYVALSYEDGRGIVWVSGGEGWRKTEYTAPGGAPFTSVLFWDGNTGLACAYGEGEAEKPSAYRTTDGGATWTALSFPVLDTVCPYDTYGVSGFARCGDKILLEFWGTNTSSGYEGSYIYYLVTQDGGETWTMPRKSRAEREAYVRFMNSTTVGAAHPFDGWEGNTAYGTVWTSGKPFGKYLGKDGTVTSHEGQDYAAAEGTPVYAGEYGTVSVRREQELGLVVEIHTSYGTVVYGGFSSVAVQDGDHVNPTMLLGYTGTCPELAQPGLHLAVYSDGVAMDPDLWLSAHSTVSARGPLLLPMPGDVAALAGTENEAAVQTAYTLACALLAGDGERVEDAVFGRYNTGLGFDNGGDYPFEDMAGFSCSAAYISVDEAREQAPVALTLTVSDPGRTCLPAGTHTWAVELRGADAANEYWPAGCVTALVDAEYYAPEENWQSSAAVFTSSFRSWVTPGSFESTEDVRDDALLFLAVQGASQARDVPVPAWTGKELAALAQKHLGLADYDPGGKQADQWYITEYDAASDTYIMADGFDGPMDMRPYRWMPLEQQEDGTAHLRLVSFADALYMMPDIAYDYTLRQNEDGTWMMVRCDVAPLREIPLTPSPAEGSGEALSDEEALRLFGDVMANATRLRKWLYNSYTRRVDAGSGFELEWGEGEPLEYVRSLDFETEEALRAAAGKLLWDGALPARLTATVYVKRGEEYLPEQRQFAPFLERDGALYVTRWQSGDYTGWTYFDVDVSQAALIARAPQVLIFEAPLTWYPDGGPQTQTVRFRLLVQDGNWVLESWTGDWMGPDA